MTADVAAPPAAAYAVELHAETDFDGFRAAARRLLAAGAAPDAVHWRVAGRADGELLDAAPALLPPAGGQPGAAAPRVPAAIVELCRSVVQHRDAARFALLYRLLWRGMHDAAVWRDPLDADAALARRMAQAVRRDAHKMRAFVRFRPLAAPDAGEPLHVAWYVPTHHVVDDTAPFFARRFANLRWSILTPDRSVRWDGAALQFGPGADPADAPAADAGEALWLTYYASIFNPARLNLRALAREMPRRYWPALPEAALIAPLAGQAAARSAAMLARPPTVAERRLPKAVMAPRPPAPPPAAPPADDRAAAWQAQRAAAAGCRECRLGALATQTVWGEGPLGAALMVVGEQPGDQEDLIGRPFVGPSGQLLARAMAELGWDRDRAYVTNAVKHFKYEPRLTPRGKRRIHKSPAQREMDACRHWLEDEIALVRPRAIVALGATAARQLLGRPVAVTRSRGSWLERDDGRRVLVTLHPSALLRLDAADRDAAYAAWLDDLRRATPG